MNLGEEEGREGREGRERELIGDTVKEQRLADVWTKQNKKEGEVDKGVAVLYL
jgi:hypothetical protein